MKLNCPAVFLLVLCLSGCCTFVPCHPATMAVGYVTDLSGQAIDGATVQLYRNKRTTKPNGCFIFDVSDGIPFTLSATAAGFNDVEVPSKAGYFIIEIRMAPLGSSLSSEVTWREIDSEGYRNVEPCN